MNGNNEIVDIHADDYGYTLNTSKDIIDCIKNHSLDSFSIIPNMPCFDECIELLYNEIPCFAYLPLISIHINLVEGTGYNGELLNEKSWGYYLFKSFSVKRSEEKNEIKKNIKFQIDKTWSTIQKCFDIAAKNGVAIIQKGIRIDSHVHTHMIPIVWESLIEVIEENKYEIEYIRNSKEPLMPFIKRKELLLTYSPINMVKNRILMFLSNRVDNYCQKKNLEKSYLCGLMMSGKMDENRIRIVYPELKRMAKNHGRNLEILFHPGRALEDERNKTVINDAFISFNSSANRCIEKRTVLNFKK